MAAEGGPQPPAPAQTWRNYFPKGDLWVFGYGSLIWKPPPHYDQRVPGYINGYVRRFWQVRIPPPIWPMGVLYHTLVALGANFENEHSTDHRGTPETPGRVVTVIEREFWETLNDPLAHLETTPEATVWGAAYHIPSTHAQEVHDYLDEREIDGYTVHYTPFHPTAAAAADSDSSAATSGPITCMVYIGQPTNPQFLRDPARRDPQDVASVINAGRGLSGRNTEYLYLLEKALQGLGLGTADAHVTDLVGRVKRIEMGVEVEEDQRLAERELRRSLSQSDTEAHVGFPRLE